MGFASLDDLISKISQSGNFWRTDWNKQTLAGLTFTIGRWYDMTILPGYPQAMVYGDLLTNGIIGGSAAGWSLGANWAYTAPNTIAKSAGAANNLAQTAMTVVAGHTYLLSYTINAYGGGGSITPSVGGTNGVARSTAATFTEVIGPVAGAGVLTFTPSLAAVTCTISNVSCVDTLYSAQLSDTMLSGAMYHGGNVTPPITKHLLNAGVVSPAGTAVPGIWLLCDMLLAYPGINLNSVALQTLTTTLTLPRYTDGKGVRAFMMPAPIASGAGAQNITFAYSNTVPTPGKTCPVTLANTASAIQGHISHSGVAANNYGPFIPLAAGDTGISKVDSIQLSGAGAAGTFATIVLCKPLCALPNTTASVLTERDLLNQLPSLPRIVDGACLGLLFFAGAGLTASNNIYGYLDFGWA